MSVILTSNTDSPEEVQRAFDAAGIKDSTIETVGEPKTDPAAPPVDAQVEAETGKGKTAEVTGAPEDKQEKKEGKEPESKKTPAGVQKRIDELTRERYERDGRITELENQLKAEREAKAAPADKTKQETVENPVAEETKPAAKPEPQQDDFADYSDYMKALIAWNVETKQVELQAELTKLRAELAEKETAKEVKSEAEVRAQEWSDRVTTAREDPYLSNWEEVSTSEEAKKVMIGAPMIDAIRESEDGPFIMHYLASHPEEAEKILDSTSYDANKATPAEVLAANRAAGREFSRLSHIVATERGKAKASQKADPATTAAAAAPAKPTKPAVTQAPEPIDPLRSSVSATGLDPYDAAAAKGMSFKEFNDWRNAHPRG